MAEPHDNPGAVRQRRGGNPQEPVRSAVVEELSDTAEDSDSPQAPKRRPSTKERLTDEDDYSPWVDVLRVISFLVVASLALSYLISGGESFTWGLKHKPRYLQLEWWKVQLQAPPQRGPIYLTPEELSLHDGSDPTKPIYLAINGSIFDVSSNARTYGPGGSYRYFAGVDAARSYVTGCFAEDRTADLRGVEAMFLPLDDPAVDAHFSAAELADIRAAELRDARDKAHEALAHWVRFFENNPKYPKVGYVRRDRDWLDSEPPKKLCDAASKARKPRKIPGDEDK
ncbi:hypothetical protein AAE478_005464 [Parahypoxylon ruwenzoriense]